MNHRDELLQAFRILPEDLEANRAGKLGTTQQRSLLRSGTLNIMAAFLLGGLLVAILYAVAERPLTPIQWILGGVMIVALLVIGIRYFIQTRMAVTKARVECMVGPVRVSRRSKAFYANIADRSFRLPIFPRFVHANTEYRVYIVPETESVVAMEPI
ncbi:MAG: hypothetical protein U0175_16835 [Caldilineaceae bacterium]